MPALYFRERMLSGYTLNLGYMLKEQSIFIISKFGKIGN